MKENNNGNDICVGSIENSIEKDIKNAEHFIKSIKTDKEYEEENGWHGYYNKEIVELARMLENILSNYKRVLKENEEFRNFLEKIIREYISDYELEQLIDRYKNESFIPRVEVKKILEDRRK